MKLKYLLFTHFAFMSFLLSAQHTFSIVAVDSITGEIGSAGATCGDSIIWPGTLGALLISDVIPGVGAIHTQSYHSFDNQAEAHLKMEQGLSPQEIITWMENNDVQDNPLIRQYGIVDYNNGSPRSAAYTGSNCFDYKNHILGPNYAIQGNILLGQEVLDNMESNFLNTNGSLADKLMAAMQGAKIIGADTRCFEDSTSSLSAFIRVALPNDHPDSLYLDCNIAGTPQWVEPIDVLQSKYNQWLLTTSIENAEDEFSFSIQPNPAENRFILNWGLDSSEKQINIYNNAGQKIWTKKSTDAQEEILIDGWSKGIYNIVIESEKGSRIKQLVVK